MRLSKYPYYVGSIFTIIGNFSPLMPVIKCFLYPARASSLKIKLRESGLEFWVRGAMDIWSLKETLVDRFYERCGFPLEDGWNVMDIGGGIGEFAILAAASSRSRVAAFEPFPQSFSIMLENVKINHLENLNGFMQAVGGESGTLLLDLSGGEPLQFQSVNVETVDGFKMDQNLNTARTIAVRSVTLEEALDEAQMPTCDLLKLDCEGAEYDILMKTPDTVLQRVKRIVMEYHDVPGHQHQELEQFLVSKGYQVNVYPNPVHDTIGYLKAYG